MLNNKTVHILTVNTIVQLPYIAFEVSINTLLETVKQQNKYNIATYEYGNSGRRQSNSLPRL